MGAGLLRQGAETGGLAGVRRWVGGGQEWRGISQWVGDTAEAELSSEPLVGATTNETVGFIFCRGEVCNASGRGREPRLVRKTRV